MEFSGPEPADFANVRALNYAFLEHLCQPGSGHSLRRQFSPGIEPLVAGLTALQIGRLAEAPFLLFSLHEFDDDYWSGIFLAGPTADLFSPDEFPSDKNQQIIAATLGFLWQLASRNPYAARISSGASLNWCERLADRTLLHILQSCAGRTDLLVPRLVDNSDLWTKLLSAGISSEPEVRAAAQQCVLQTLLTDPNSSSYHPLRAAACRLPPNSLQVAETPASRSRRKKS
jgi:hypothetical protein